MDGDVGPMASGSAGLLVVTRPLLAALLLLVPLLPSSTSPVDYGGDEAWSPCPGSKLPYHLHHRVQVGRSLTLFPPKGEEGAPLQSAERWTLTEGSLEGIPPLAYSHYLLMFISCPRRTRHPLALTRAKGYLPCRRTRAKALRSVRRTFPASRRGMYTVPSLAVLGARPEGRAPLQRLPSPRSVNLVRQLTRMA